MHNDMPIFSATDVADIIEVKPSQIRDWRDRGLSMFIGTKADHFVEYSVREVGIAAVTRDLVRLNFPLRIAAQAACALLEHDPPPNAVFRGGANEIAALVPTHGPNAALMHREVLSAPDVADAVIELPVGATWARIVERASRVYKRGGIAVA